MGLDFDIYDIKKKIDNYFLGNESKEELGKWAKIAYYDLLKGEYLQMEKIVSYPFLKVISNYHIEEEDIKDIFPVDEKEIELIRDILHGKYNETYSIDVCIPWRINDKYLGLDKIKRKQYIKIIDILSKYSNKEIFTKDDYKECVNTFKMPEDEPGTIQYILENNIKSLLKNNIDWEEGCLDIQQGMGIYVQKRKREVDIVNKIIRYLQCYIGERSVEVDIIFILGRPQVIFSMWFKKDYKLVDGK